MHSASRLALLIGVVACLGCAAGVQVEVAPDQDFSRYRSWDWLPRGWEKSSPTSDAQRAVVRAVRVALERELAARGLERVTDEDPDFFLACHVELSNEVEVYYETPAMQTLSSVHDSPSYEVTVSERRVRFYQEATIAIDVAESRDRQLVWRGTRSRRVRGRFAPHASEVVQEILLHFPAGAGTVGREP